MGVADFIRIISIIITSDLFSLISTLLQGSERVRGPVGAAFEQKSGRSPHVRSLCEHLGAPKVV